MPRKGDLMDGECCFHIAAHFFIAILPNCFFHIRFAFNCLSAGRVGTWSNEELLETLDEKRYGIVANEWEPLSMEKLALSNRQLDGSTSTKNDSGNHSPKLLFLTTLRDPIDRLLSAYTFFAKTTTGAGKKGNDAPTYSQWIDNNMRRLKRYKPGSNGAGFRANAVRDNHIVWRFSGGGLSTVQGRYLRKLEEKDWMPHFETAIKTLSQQDLILPMDAMTKGEGKLAMQQLLGWDRFDLKGRFGGEKESGHVVTKGEIKNSNAREYFSNEEYRDIWEANWLDNILVLWSKAVFFARLHCKDVIANP